MGSFRRGSCQRKLTEGVPYVFILVNYWRKNERISNKKE